MKNVLIATVAAVGLATAGAAFAQSSQTTTTTTQTTETTGSISIAPEKRTVIRQHITKQAQPVQIKEKVTIGMTVPQDVELMEVPQTIVTDVPSVKGYRYFVYQDDVVFVDPRTRRVVTIIE